MSRRFCQDLRQDMLPLCSAMLSCVKFALGGVNIQKQQRIFNTLGKTESRFTVINETFVISSTDRVIKPIPA